MDVLDIPVLKERPFHLVPAHALPGVVQDHLHQIGELRLAGASFPRDVPVLVVQAEIPEKLHLQNVIIHSVYPGFLFLRIFSTRYESGCGITRAS